MKAKRNRWVAMHISSKVKRKLSLNIRQRIIRNTWQQCMLSMGAMVIALGYVLFQLPYNIAAGGISGLGIIVHRWIDFPVGAFFLLANIPLFMLGYHMLGKWRFVWSSCMAVSVFSIAADLFAIYLPVLIKTYPVTEDAMLAAIYAGICNGLGGGLIYRYGGTVGGTSITARIIYNKTGFPMSQSFLFTDLAIICLAMIVFTLEAALLAILTLILSGLFSDFILEGPIQMRTIMIISEKPDAVRDAILYELQRSLYSWEVTGGYLKTKRTLLYLTVLRSKVYDLKHIISRIDEKAFMVVGVSHQAWGDSAPIIPYRRRPSA